MKTAKDVDAYMAALPTEVRAEVAVLRALRVVTKDDMTYEYTTNLNKDREISLTDMTKK